MDAWLKRWVLFGVLISFSGVCAAEAVWPALLLASRLTTGWAITIGLVVEFLAVWKVFGIPWRRAVTVDAAMNAASTILGALVIPFVGLSAHMFIVAAGATLEPLLWGIPILLAVSLYAAVEWVVLVKGFHYRAGRRTFLFLAAANSISVALALLSVHS